MKEEHRIDYLEAVELAESGHYEQALRQMQAYLKAHPEDGEALNDAGTILYCMHRGQEAIEYFVRARSRCKGDTLSHVLFNLCEAYLAENQPDQAVGLFKDLEERGILNIDTVNRIANAFVSRGACGPAIEVLLYSLRMASGQEILKPILEILRAKRIQPVLAADREGKIAPLKRYLEDRFVVETFIGEESGALSAASSADVFICAGCRQLARVTLSGRGPVIGFLDYEDLQSDDLEKVCWENIHTLVLPGKDAEELFRERLETVPASLQVLTLAPCVDVESIVFSERRKGKRIAAIGPWDAHQNPMLLMACMQKLHYLDPDARLYLAGEFEDDSIRHYTESMIEAMGLENTVFLDGTPKNLNRWLRDKHYIASTAVDGRGLKGILTGMAAGLRPVVHQFPHASDFLGPDYLFLLAEDFCRQILEGDYQPQQYRQTVAERYSTLESYPAILRILSVIEHQKRGQSVPAAAPSAAAMTAEPVKQEVAEISRPPVSPSPPSYSMEKGIQEMPMTGTPSGSETIEELAQKALQAARRLSELSREHVYPAESTAAESKGGRSEVPFLHATR